MALGEQLPDTKSNPVVGDAGDGEASANAAPTVSTTTATASSSDGGVAAGQGPRKAAGSASERHGEEVSGQPSASIGSVNSTMGQSDVHGECDNRNSKLLSSSSHASASPAPDDNNRDATTTMVVVATSSSGSIDPQSDDAAAATTSVSSTPTMGQSAMNREAKGPSSAEHRDINDNNLSDKASEAKSTSGKSSCPGVVSTTTNTTAAADADRSEGKTDCLLSLGSTVAEDDGREEPSTSANIKVTDSPKAQQSDEIEREVAPARVGIKIESSNDNVVAETAQSERDAADTRTGPAAMPSASAEEQQSNCDSVQSVDIKKGQDEAENKNSATGNVNLLACDGDNVHRTTKDREFEGGGVECVAGNRSESHEPQPIAHDKVQLDGGSGATESADKTTSAPEIPSMVSQSLLVEQKTGVGACDTVSTNNCPTSSAVTTSSAAVDQANGDPNTADDQMKQVKTELVNVVKQIGPGVPTQPGSGCVDGVAEAVVDNKKLLTETEEATTTAIEDVSGSSSSVVEREIMSPDGAKDSRVMLEDKVDLPKHNLNIDFGRIRDDGATAVCRTSTISGKVNADSVATTTMTIISESPTSLLSNERPLPLESVSGSRSISASSSSPSLSAAVLLTAPPTAPPRPKLLANLKPKSPDRPEEEEDADEDEHGLDSAKNTVSGSAAAEAAESGRNSEFINHNRLPSATLPLRSSVVVATVQYANSSSASQVDTAATPAINKTTDDSSKTYINKRSSLYVNSPDFSKKSTMVSPVAASLPTGSPFKTAPAAVPVNHPPSRPTPPLVQLSSGPATTTSESSRHIFAPNLTATESRPQFSGGDQYDLPAFSSQKDLSTLKMKTPDFSKLSSIPTTTNQVPSTQNSSVQPNQPSAHFYKSPAIDPNSFQEIRKKYNYISDLQLKPQSEPAASNVRPTEPTTTSLAGSAPMIPVNSDYRQQQQSAKGSAGMRRDDPNPSSVSYPNLYVNTPDFTAQKFVNHSSRGGIDTKPPMTTPPHPYDPYERQPSAHPVRGGGEYQPKLYPITVQEQHLPGRLGYSKSGSYGPAVPPPPPQLKQEVGSSDQRGALSAYSQEPSRQSLPPHRHNYPPVKTKTEPIVPPLVDYNYNYAAPSRPGTGPVKVEGLSKSATTSSHDFDPRYPYHIESGAGYSMSSGGGTPRYGSQSTQSSATQPPPLRYGENGPEGNYQGSVIKSRPHEELGRQSAAAPQQQQPPSHQRHDYSPSVVVAQQQQQQSASVISLKQQQTDLLRTDLKRIHSPNQATSGGSYMPAPYTNMVGQIHPTHQQQSPSPNQWPPPSRSSSVGPSPGSGFAQPFPKSASSSPVHMHHQSHRMAPSPTAMMRPNMGSPAQQHPSSMVPGGGVEKPVAGLDYYKRPITQRVGYVDLTRTTPQHNSHQQHVVPDKYASTGDLSRPTAVDNPPPLGNRYGSADRLSYEREPAAVVEVKIEPTKGGVDEYNRQQQHRPTVDPNRGGHYLATCVPPVRNEQQTTAMSSHVQMPLSNFPKFHLQGGNSASVTPAEVNNSRSGHHSQLPIAMVKAERSQPASPIVSNSQGPVAPSSSSASSSAAPRVKRESPLDLSVKTVKTKADSTGGFYDNGLPVVAGPKATNSLKVNYVPNFAQHQRGQSQLPPKDQPGHSRLSLTMATPPAAATGPQSHPAMGPDRSLARPIYPERDSTYQNIGYPDSRHMTPPAQVHPIPHQESIINKSPAGYPMHPSAYGNSGPSQPLKIGYPQKPSDMYSAVAAKIPHDIHLQPQNSHPHNQGHYQVAAASGSQQQLHQHHQPRYAEANYPHAGGRAGGGAVVMSGNHLSTNPVPVGHRPPIEIPRHDEPVLERKRHADFAHLSTAAGQQPAPKTIKANDPYQSPMIPNHQYDAYAKREAPLPNVAPQPPHHPQQQPPSQPSVSRGHPYGHQYGPAGAAASGPLPPQGYHSTGESNKYPPMVPYPRNHPHQQLPAQAIPKREPFSPNNYPGAGQSRPEIGLENRTPHHAYQSPMVTRPESSRDYRPQLPPPPPTGQAPTMNNHYAMEAKVQYAPDPPPAGSGLHPVRPAPNNSTYPHHHQMPSYTKATMPSHHMPMNEVNAYAKPLAMNVHTVKVDHSRMHAQPMATSVPPQQHPYLDSRQQIAVPKGSGADRDVISKLKNTIEEKQHQRLIKKQTSVEGLAEELCCKGDIASILAARIRTKGELKGYIAPPATAAHVDNPDHKLPLLAVEDNEVAAAVNVNPKERFDPPSDMEGVSGFDLMDWGSACNDFVEQLQTGKKKPKRRKTRKSEDVKLELKQEAPDEIAVQPVVEVVQCVSVVPHEAIRDADKLVTSSKAANSEGSSDEDKPLVLIRQQSLNERAKVTESDVNSRSSSVLTAGRIYDRVTGAAIVKGVKEKRLLQEKRYAARIANATSSESETESKKKPLKPFKRKKVALKAPSTLAPKANNRGSESSQEEEADVDPEERKKKGKAVATTSPTTTSTMTTKSDVKLVDNQTRKRGKSNKTDSSDSEADDDVSRMPVKKRIGAAASDKNKDNGSTKQVVTPVPARDKLDASLDETQKQKRGPKKASSKPTKEKANRDSSEDSSESGEKEVAKKAMASTTNKKSKNAVAAKSLSDAESKARRSKESTTPTRTNKMRRNKSPDVGPKNSSAHKEPKLKSKREEHMTRSKKKQEMAEQKANSLVLRNDKVIQGPSSRAATKVTPAKVGGLKRKVSDVEEGKTKKGNKKIASKPVASSSSSPSSDEDEEEASDSSESESSESGAETAVSVRLRPRRAKEIEKETNVRRPRSIDADKKALLGSSSIRAGDGSKKAESGAPDQVDVEREQSDKVAIPPPSNPVAAAPPPPSKKGGLKRQRQETVEKEREDRDGAGADEKSRSTKKGRKAGGDQQKFDPGWEDQLYEFKRSLKVPASLITIESPKWHRVSTSLPDLEPRSNSDEDGEEEEDDMVDDDSHRGEMLVEEEPVLPKRSSSTLSSIIDLVHQRVIWPIKRLAQIGAALETFEHKKPSSSVMVGDKANHSLLLPTPVLVKSTRTKDDDNDVEDYEEVIIKNEFKKKSVKKSRTRKEYQVERNRDIIREIFGGEDRPASAPPGCTGRSKKAPPKSDEKEVQKIMNEYEAIVINKMTYEQKFEEYLGLYSTPEENCTVSNKSLQLAMSIDEAIKEDVMIFQRPMVQGEDPEHGGLVKRRLGKRAYTRRKGSSGFDYIRKKKRPVPVNMNGMVVHSQVAQLRRRTQMITFVKDRSEQDISKEIKCWVLNKGVGESVLHKATRMNLLDVVAYCLIRLDMAPDQKDNAGYTPLHEACSRGHLDIARLLLQHGANPSETSPSGIRPLHDAVENGDMEIVRLLLAYGADPQLATYAGQTPLDLAEDDEMDEFLLGHLYDLNYFGSDKKRWRFAGPWQSTYDPESGYNILHGAPEEIDCPKRINRYKKKRKSSSDDFFKVTNENRASSLNLTVQKLSDELNGVQSAGNSPTIAKRLLASLPSSPVDVVDSNVSLPEPRETVVEAFGNSDEGELFEFEECETVLPPVYYLKDEGADKWCMWTDLQNLLKVKSKETLLKQICPPTGKKEEFVREFKMNEFLQKATCLQLLCSGEKLNIRASKVSLIKYTDSVKALLGVNTLVLRL